MSESLADKIISQLEQGDTDEDSQYWGIDELGLPIPNPVNIAYVVARIFARYENIFKIHNEMFVDRKPVRQNNQTLLSLCGRVELMSVPNGKDKRDIEPWDQTRRVVNRETPLVWKKLIELAPAYNRDYINN